jgi:hypothetical protein
VIVATIQGKGLLSEIAVVENVEATLLTDLEFTRHGIVLVQADTQLLGVFNGSVLFRGTRDPQGERGTAEALWLLDLDVLFNMEAPVRPAEGLPSAQAMVDMLWQSINSTCGSRGQEDSTAFAGGARPEYSRGVVREARRAIKGCNSISVRAVGHSLVGWHGVPDGLDSRLFNKIAARRGHSTHHGETTHGHGD